MRQGDANHGDANQGDANQDGAGWADVTSTRDVAVITPWYPTRQLPFRGAFVQAMVAATAPMCDRVTVYHCDGWWSRMSDRTDRAVRRAHTALLPTALQRTSTVADAELVYVPVPTPSGTTYADIARRHEVALRVALGGVGLAAPVVHAHVGFYSGWAAVRNARVGARVFVTEHATFLPAVLAEPAARAMYEQVLARVAGLFAVGQAVRAPLVEAFPQHADRIGLIANPVSFDVVRPVPVDRLRRWLFVGGLIERKGVDVLVEAFALCRAEDPSLTLTLVGSGERAAALRARTAELGIADAVTFTGAVTPERAVALMREHDLLVHPSRMETFGVTVVEAIAAGMPVLVTRCGGPEETLAGIAESAAELIPVDDEPATIVAGYRRLRDRFPHRLNLDHARHHLADRYSYPAVADAHQHTWFPTTASPSSSATSDAA
jgi:glycogen(starch) synthase